jgi:hypothetical protein
MRKLIIHIRSEHNEWTETYREGERASFSVGEPDLEVWAQELVTRFNKGLKLGESPRHVTKIEVSEFKGEVKREHQWTKTNLVTIERAMQFYDTARCDVCGITAKRYGVGDTVRDPKWSAKKYAFCGGVRLT